MATRMADIDAELANPKGEDPELSYGTLPADCGGERVGLGKLSSVAEIECDRIANGSELASSYEMTKRAIREKDGRPFSLALSAKTNEFDSWWEKIGPRGRKCLTFLYAQHNGFTAEARDSFFVTVETPSARKKKLAEAAVLGEK